MLNKKITIEDNCSKFLYLLLVLWGFVLILFVYFVIQQLFVVFYVGFQQFEVLIRIFL